MDKATVPLLLMQSIDFVNPARTTSAQLPIERRNRKLSQCQPCCLARSR